MKLLDKLICAIKGHRRGKRDDKIIVNMGEQGYRCPRCGATWTRKVKEHSPTWKRDDSGDTQYEGKPKVKA